VLHQRLTMARLRFPQLLSRPAAVIQRGGGYTLVELLVGVALGSIVLGALGGALLVSATKVSRKINTDLDSKDSLNRAVALMRDEISSAGLISINNSNQFRSASNPCWGLRSGDNLYLWRAANTIICYKTFSLASVNTVLPTNAPADRPWSGPCVLVRYGPAYKANGELDNSIGNITQVVLDGLLSCSTASAALGLSVTNSGVAGSPISRDVDVTINQAGGIATTFSARSASNPLNAGNDLYPSSCSGSGAAVPLCKESANERHFMPTMNATPATCSAGTDCKPDKENIFYFKSAFSAYTLRESARETLENPGHLRDNSL